VQDGNPKTPINMQAFCKKLSTLIISIVCIFNIAAAQYCVPPLTGEAVFANIAKVSFADYTYNVPGGLGHYKIESTNKSFFRGQTFILKSLLKRVGTKLILILMLLLI